MPTSCAPPRTPPSSPAPLACALAALALAGLAPCVGAADEAPPPSETPAEQSGEQAGAPAVSLGDVLSGAEGVRVATMCTNCNIANVTMFGQSDERVQVWLDGLPTVGGLGAIYALSILPGELLAQTEVVRGAGTVLSGSEASAGAIVLTTKAPAKTPHVVASVDNGSYGWAGAKAHASGKIGRFGGALTLTNAASAGIDPNRDGAFELGELRRTTAGAELTLDVTRDTMLRLSGLHYREEQRDNKGGVKALAPTTKFWAEDVDIDRSEFSLALEHRFRNASRLTFVARATEREQSTRDDSVVAQPYLTVDEAARQAEVRQQTPLGDRFLLTTGLVQRRVETTGRNTRVPPFLRFLLGLKEQVISDVIDHRGGYAELGAALGQGFDLTAGARYDDYGAFGAKALPRARLAWQPIPQLGVALSAGAGFRTPRPAYERVCCGARPVSIAFFKAETSRNYLLDIDAAPIGALRLRGSLFRSDFDDFLLRLAADTNDFSPTLQAVNFPRARIEGGELQVDARWRGLTLTLSGTRVSPRSLTLATVHPYVDVPNPVPPDEAKQVLVDTLRAISYDLPPGVLPNHPRDSGAAALRWDDDRRGLHFALETQYTGSVLIQKLRRNPQVLDQPARPYELRRTPAVQLVNLRSRARLHKGLALYGGVDNLGNKVQDLLDRPEYEYNWGPLRGRYYYFGLSYEL